MHLVLVESGAKAKTIQGYLNGFGMGEFQVMASLGHVMDLPVKTMGVDVASWTPEYAVSEGKKALVRKIIQVAKAADRVSLAADPDREGEAIAFHLNNLLRDAGVPASRMQRVVFHEITKEALREAITHPRALDTNLIHAQETRRILDRVVGYEASPLLWRRFASPGLSAGRVQSAALKLVVERYKAATEHSYAPYWVLRGSFQLDHWPDALDASATDEWDDPEVVLAELHRLAGFPRWRLTMQQSTGVRRPPAPFTTSSLQQEAAQSFGFPIEMTMKLAQELYEMGCITYMRTDATTLSKSSKEAIAAWIRAHHGEESVQLRNFKTTVANAQEAHEAIRPTVFSLEGEAKLQTETQRKLYGLIWRRTVASQMKEATLLTVRYTVVPEASGAPEASKAPVLKGSMEVLTDLGFKVVLQPEAKIDHERIAYLQALMKLPSGNVVPLAFSFEGNVRRPEPLFQEATLVKHLERKGIGRPSTFAPTLKKLMTRKYVGQGGLPARKETVVHYHLDMIETPGHIRQEEAVLTLGGTATKALVPSSLGCRIIDYLNTALTTLVDIDFTADMESKLDIISRGEQTKEATLTAFYEAFHPDILNVQGAAASAPTAPSAEAKAKAKTKANAKEKTKPIEPKTVLKDFPEQGAKVVQTRFGEALFVPETQSWVSVAPFLEWREKTVADLTAADLGFLRGLPLKVAGGSLEIHLGRYGLYVKDTDNGRNLTLEKGVWDTVYDGTWTPASIQEKIKAPALRSGASRARRRPK